MTAIRKHLGDFAAMLGLMAIALFAVGYIIVHQDARGPIPIFESKPFEGKVADVETKNGIAVVTLAIDQKYKKKLNIRSDATALLRPRTGLKDMFVELDPGYNGQVLKSGGTISVANTSPD